MARANGLANDDPRLIEVATLIGADVPVCLASRACDMTGVGETLLPLSLPIIPCVLVNPRVPVATREVFAALGLRNGELLVGFADVLQATAWPEEGASIERSTVRGPAIIGRGTRIVNSYVGPFTSIYHDCLIESTEVEHSIVLESTTIIGVSRIEDSLIVRYVIGKDGRVKEVKVIDPPKYQQFADAAIKAISHWRFQPLIANGEKEEVVHELTVNFQLR